MALLSPGGKLFAGDLLQVPAAIQISSRISDGKYSIPEIVRICRDGKYKVVVITDRDLMRWEYGIWPLRNIFKRTVEDKSLLKYGAKRYLDELNAVQSLNPDLVIIPGVESAPFYYWQGDLFHSNLELLDWHKHMIAIGLDSAEVLERLPVVGNKKGLAEPSGLRDLLLLWPVSLLVAGLFCLRKRTYDYSDQSGRPLAPFSKSWRRTGFIFMAAGLLFLAENFPFRTYSFDQYHGDAGIKPYQDYIDYVNNHSGLSFWAHPEARNVDKIDDVSVRTEEHVNNLMLSRDYTGFAVFYEGFKIAGKVGGVWDSLLLDYCQGKRKNPVWAIGGLSFDSNGNLEDYLQDLRTVLLLPELNRAEALKALKSGRMYAIRGKDSSQFVLRKFSVSDSSSGEEKIMGQELRSVGAPQISMSVDLLNGQQQPFKIKLIRDGKIVNTFEASTPAELSYVDEQAPAAGTFYYRLEINSSGVVAITNPIFVRKAQSR